MANIEFNTTTVLDPDTFEGFHIKVETAFGVTFVIDVEDLEVIVRYANVTKAWVFYYDAIKAARRHYIETGLRRVGLAGVMEAGGY